MNKSTKYFHSNTSCFKQIYRVMVKQMSSLMHEKHNFLFYRA